MPYLGRPGPSPVLAALVASGTLRRTARVLDVGCGNGTDALALVRWGFRGVVGIDTDRRVLGIARGRAKRLGSSSRVRFEEADVRKLADHFPAGSFDAVVDTLLLNNIETKGGDTDAYARSVAHVLAKGGLFVCQMRIHKRDEKDPIPLPVVFEKWFDLGATVSTHIPERHPDGNPDQALVSVEVGWRNGRRVR